MLNLYWCVYMYTFAISCCYVEEPCILELVLLHFELGSGASLYQLSPDPRPDFTNIPMKFDSLRLCQSYCCQFVLFYFLVFIFSKVKCLFHLFQELDLSLVHIP